MTYVDRDAGWAAAAVRDWYGEPAPGHFAHAIHAANSGAAQANEKLLAVISDSSIAGIVRATALSLYRLPLTRAQAQSVQNALRDADPLVRIGTLRTLSFMPPELAAQWAGDLLEDPVRAVRLEAFDVLSPARAALPAASLQVLRRVQQEFVATQIAIAERPEAHANLAHAYATSGNHAAAEASYLTALEREPRAAGFRVNLADLYRQMQREEDAEAVLRSGLDIDGENAALRHSLGLLLVRSQRTDEALQELQLAAQLAPGVSRYAYVYGIALHSVGRTREAIDAMSVAARTFPADFDIGWAYVTLLRDASMTDAARDAAADLLARFPENENVLGLLRSFDAG